MLHVATVHHRSPRWLAVQRSYLDRHLTEPFRVVASLEGVDESLHALVDEVVPSAGKHAGKLNLLAHVVAQTASPDDVLVFLDGDAFPIADPMPTIRDALARTPLVAVRRDENVGDRQPHPCFCATTVGFWTSLPGDWSAGGPWTNAAGEVVSDVGGNLLWLLERDGIEWTPLLRTNRVDLHPVWFAVYGGIVYHHGAGFRRMISRADFVDLGVRRRADRRRDHSALQELQIRRRQSAMRRIAADVERDLRTNPEFHRRFA